MTDDGIKERRSYDCSLDAHHECAHRIGLGGGFNPRRLRLEFGEVLCRCSCHSSCPLAGQDNVKPEDWRDRCSCPGAQREREAEARRSGPPPELGEILRARIMRARRENQERRRTDSAGPLNAMREVPYAVRMLVAAGGEARRLLQLFRGVERVQDPSGQNPYFTAPGTTAAEIEVILDPGAERVLESGSRQREPGVSDPKVLLVRLEQAEATEAGRAVTVYVDAHRVGVLSQGDSLALGSALETAAEQSRSLMMLGAYRPAVHGSPSLRVYPAGPRRR